MVNILHGCYITMGNCMAVTLYHLKPATGILGPVLTSFGDFRYVCPNRIIDEINTERLRSIRFDQKI